MTIKEANANLLMVLPKTSFCISYEFWNHATPPYTENRHECGSWDVYVVGREKSYFGQTLAVAVQLAIDDITRRTADMDAAQEEVGHE